MLGFEVRADMKMGEFRWLTVAPKAQRQPEIILMPVVAGPTMDAAAAAALRGLLAKGAISCGVPETDDCQGMYNDLKAKGGTFLSAPQQRPYGLEAILKDDSGNWGSRWCSGRPQGCRPWADLHPYTTRGGAVAGAWRTTLPATARIECSGFVIARP